MTGNITFSIISEILPGLCFYVHYLDLMLSAVALGSDTPCHGGALLVPPAHSASPLQLLLTTFLQLYKDLFGPHLFWCLYIFPTLIWAFAAPFCLSMSTYLNWNL